MGNRDSRQLVRRVIGPAATAALLPALMLTGGQASAARPSAHRPAAIARVISASLNSVSCKGNSFCMAAGGYSTTRSKGLKLIEAWNGKIWRDVPDGLRGHLSLISCGSPAFCFAGRGSSGGLAAVWNGRTWKAFIDAFDAAGATCGSPKLCMHLDERAIEIDVWNGKRWRTDPAANACNGPAPGPCGYNGLSGGSASTCMALSFGCDTQDCQDGLDEFAAVWNGTSWQASSRPGNGNLSCSRGLCMLIVWNKQDHAPTANIWDSGGWQDITPNVAALCASAPECRLPVNRGLSCGAPRACVTIASGSPVSLIWTNHTWKAVPLATIHGTVPSLRELSCGSATNCMAIGSYGNPSRPVAEHWNGTTWQLTTPVNH